MSIYPRDNSRCSNKKKTQKRKKESRIEKIFSDWPVWKQTNTKRMVGQKKKRKRFFGGQNFGGRKKKIRADVRWSRRTEEAQRIKQAKHGGNVYGGEKNAKTKREERRRTWICRRRWDIPLYRKSTVYEQLLWWYTEIRMRRMMEMYLWMKSFINNVWQRR